MVKMRKNQNLYEIFMLYKRWIYLPKFQIIYDKDSQANSIPQKYVFKCRHAESCASRTSKFHLTSMNMKCMGKVLSGNDIDDSDSCFRSHRDLRFLLCLLPFCFSLLAYIRVTYFCVWILMKMSLLVLYKIEITPACLTFVLIQKQRVLMNWQTKSQFSHNNSRCLQIIYIFALEIFP